MIDPVQASADVVSAHKHELMEGAGQAILKAIREHNATHPRQLKAEGTDGGVASFSQTKP